MQGGRARRRFVLPLFVLWVVLTALVAVAGNLAANDPPEWLKPYVPWAWPVFLGGSLLLGWLYWRDRPAREGGSRLELDEGNRRRMLERVRSQVEDLLWQPPDDPALIRLGLVARPELVATPRERFAQRLAEAAPAIDRAFDVAEGALLLVGTPGAGKSRLLAQLAHVLVARAEQDPVQPVPVVVSLASWAAPQSLAEWLAGELRDRYDVPSALGQACVAAGQVLPLLDGLDEADDPAACIAAVNAFRGAHGLVPVVVCCRLADYERLGVRLRLRGAVELQAPTPQQTEDYLAQAGVALPAVRAALGGEEGWELLSSPLTLSVVARTYQAQPQALLTTAGTAAQLFDAYIDAMLARRRTQPAPGKLTPAPAYGREQTLGWLGWLARGMRDHRQTQFRLDRLQPTWLATPAQRRA
ncbi:MAG: NACHT domain-containing protein, partial [Egibacteraceae bacterium]